MPKTTSTLYLTETRAKTDYVCPACKEHISRGARHYRHDPHPYARMYRDQPTTHWCYHCIQGSSPVVEQITGRLRVPIVQVTGERERIKLDMGPLFESVVEPIKVELIGIGPALIEKILADLSLIYQLSPSQFEELICERLYAMGLEPRRIGRTNQKDGGVDVVFWPRLAGAFPFLGAAQVKHHKEPRIKEGPSTVRDFAGVLANNSSFNAGVIVTNTSFTPDAQWFAKERAKLIKLREISDVRRWLKNGFTGEEEWREIPAFIELCPGVTVKIR